MPGAPPRPSTTSPESSASTSDPCAGRSRGLYPGVLGEGGAILDGLLQVEAKRVETEHRGLGGCEDLPSRRACGGWRWREGSQLISSGLDDAGLETPAVRCGPRVRPLESSARVSSGSAPITEHFEPGQARVCPAAHRVVAGAVARIEDQRDLRDHAVGHGIDHLRTRSDDSPLLAVAPDHETGRVADEHQRQVPLVAVHDESAALSALSS